MYKYLFDNENYKNNKNLIEYIEQSYLYYLMRSIWLYCYIEKENNI